MRIPTRIAKATALSLLLAATASAADTAAEPPASTPGGEFCIGLNQIDRSKILDSQHLLFTMNNKRLYINTLPVSCGGMRPGTTYSFRTSQTRLCQGDIITMMRPGGRDFIPGASCGLGMFEQVTTEQLDSLKAAIESSKP